MACSMVNSRIGDDIDGWRWGIPCGIDESGEVIALGLGSFAVLTRQIREETAGK